MTVSISGGQTLLLIQTVHAEGIDVPTNQAFDLKAIATYLKTFTLDKLAVMIANQLLQRMTASVVNWINRGFEGSPAFITNPEGFFMDVGDQITGEFLSGSGDLSRLCSPFSFDIRLNIGLNQATSYNKRYDCTLSRVIANTQNSIETIGQNSGINIYGSTDGATLGNFINGDFSQGGWGGFIAYTTEPQNNPFGATLMAQSDLQSRIDTKKTAINTDLNRGQGFLSWQKCTDVTENYNSSNLGGESVGLTAAQEDQLRRGGEQTAITGTTNLGKSTSIQKRIGKDNLERYYDCQTQTPGSAIASSLFNQADTGREKLVLVKTISDSIDAMLGALTNQMLVQGLAALSDRNSSAGGGSQSYLTQLYQESGDYYSSESQNLRNRSGGMADAITVLSANNANTYQQMIDLLNNSRSKFVTAQTCFSAKLGTISNLSTYEKSYAESQIKAIDLIISRDIDPLISSTTVKKLTARRQSEVFQDSVNSATGGDTTVPNLNTNDFEVGFGKVETAVSAGTRAVQLGIDSASDVQKEHDAMKTYTENLNKNAQIFQDSCNEFPKRNWLGR